MKRLLTLLTVALFSLSACSAGPPGLPTPGSGTKAYSETGAGVTLTARLPSSWRLVDASRLPEQSEIDSLTAAGDPLGAFLKSMSADITAKVYVFEAIDPSSVGVNTPFADSVYLAAVPGYGQGKTPDQLLAENLAATRDRYHLAGLPPATPVGAPKGFDHAWEIEYAWTASNASQHTSVDLAGLHYLLLRGNDAWILGFNTIRANGPAALPTWRQIAGSLSVH